ncbi:MATE family efflux transporter [Maribacter sp. ANRC-HE7]|uniref:Multidrug export protein MepA n=1 Tax=Maribacter aquimaris TaxID=2737171 RepID=A0ABR7V0M8_9FLAO|nr:MATE family efflux transporter [Maribacter aquimaris]MBD0777880.1 MATE family efflux transporter [Maribacter aquimaris]
MRNLKTIFHKLFLFLKDKKQVFVSLFRKNDKAYSLKEDSILKLLIVFVGPAVLGMLVNILYNVVDRIFVGQFVGAEGISAVTLVFPINFFQFGFVLLFGSGAGVLIAKYLGENRLDKAEEVFGTMLAGLLIVMVLFTTAGLFFYKDLLVVFGAQGSLLSLSSDYLFIIVMGFPLSFFIALEFTSRAEGNPHLPAKLVLISSLINVSLDYVFMKIFGLGVQGAALATVIAQGTNAVLLLNYYFNGKSLVKLVWKQIKLKKEIILPILAVGLAPFVMDIAVSFQNAFANHLLLESGGSDAVAVMGIIFGINVFFMMTALGTGDGMQPIISYNYGAKQYARALTTLKYVLVFVLLAAFLGITAIAIFPESIIGVFIDDNVEIVSLTKSALEIFVISIPFFMIQVVVTRYFQAIQKNTVATFLAIFRPVLLFIPIAYLLNNSYGLVGVWIAFVVSDSLAAIISLLLVKKYSIKKLKIANSNEQFITE